MLWLIALVVVVALIFAAFYLWARHKATAGAEPHAGRLSKRWVLFFTEALALIGGIFLVAGGSVAATERWMDITDWGHVAIFAGAGILFLLIALRMREFTQPAAAHAAGFAWLSSAACMATGTGIAVHDVFAQPWEVTALAAGIAISVYSGGLWLAFRHEWQMAGLFIGLTTTICAAILTVTGSAAPWLTVALGLWAFGLGWTLLGLWYPDPLWTTVPLATAIALIAPAFAVWNHGWVFAIGIATAGAAMLASVPLRNTMLLTAGATTLAGYVMAAVARYYRVLLGLPGTLAICGLVLLALALVAATFWQTMRPPEGGADQIVRLPPGTRRPRGRPGRARWSEPAGTHQEAELHVDGSAGAPVDTVVPAEESLVHQVSAQ